MRPTVAALQGVTIHPEEEQTMMISTKWLACALAVASIASSTSMAQCPGFPGCLYQPPPVPFVETEDSVTYTDIAGHERTVNILLRQPDVPLSPLPVVVLVPRGRGRSDQRPHAR